MIIFDKIDNILCQLMQLDNTNEDFKDIIRGIEGISSKYYFEAISMLIPDQWSFNGRSRNPAVDEFNCLLNYGYGILYSMVEKACIVAGLDPYIGILHTDNYNKKSLVFDIIEMYRIYIDKAVVTLLAKKQIKDDFFDSIPNGLSLNYKGKRILIDKINEIFDSDIDYNGRNIKLRNIIQSDCHKIANDLISGGENCVNMGNL